MINLMGKEYIYIRMGLSMKDNGKMINKKELEKKDGWMVLGMKENIKMEKRMEKENFIGLMVQIMKEIL